MNDDQLLDAWMTLAPTPPGRRRMEARVFAWLDAADTSIAAEWLGLLRVAPGAALGLVAVSAVAILATTPVVWVARALGRVLG